MSYDGRYTPIFFGIVRTSLHQRFAFSLCRMHGIAAMHGTCKKHGHSRMPSSHHPKTKAHCRSDTLELSIRMLPSSPAFAVRVIPAAPCGLTLRPACIPSGLSRPSYGSNEPQTGVTARVRPGRPRLLPCPVAYQSAVVPGGASQKGGFRYYRLGTGRQLCAG